MGKKLISIDATPIEVAEGMRNFRTDYRNRISWSECLRLGKAKNSIGEIRTVDDWKNVPRGTNLRAVFLIDQGSPVIRWGKSDFMLKILGGSDHDHLVFQGDNLENAKSGYIAVERDGSILVWSAMQS